MNVEKMSSNEYPYVTTGTFDPELLYIECATCGKALNWQQGETTDFVVQSGINPNTLDYSYMIYSLGCPHCLPDQMGYVTRLVQIAGKDMESVSVA